MTHRRTFRGFLLVFFAVACATVSVAVVWRLAKGVVHPNSFDANKDSPAQSGGSKDESFIDSTKVQPDVPRRLAIGPNSEAGTRSVQLTPSLSVPSHTRLSVNWSRDKSLGLRMLHRPGGVRVGPVSILSHQGQLFVADGADGRLVHMGSDGHIVESFDLPIQNLQRVKLLDDGRILAWGASEQGFIFLSEPFLGEIQNLNDGPRWEKISRPQVLAADTKKREPLIPTYFSSIAGTLYAEHKYGELFPISSQVGQLGRTLPGRPSRSEKTFIRFKHDIDQKGPIIVQAFNGSEQPNWERELPFVGQKSRVLALEISPLSDFFVVAWEGYQNRQVKTLCAKFNFNGQLQSLLELEQTNGDGIEVIDPIVVDDRNSFLHMRVRVSGMTVERHVWK